MSTKSAIEWTQSTWNPVTGCTKISLGCVGGKQWGGVNKKLGGRQLEGRMWDELPQAAVPRERRSVPLEMVRA